MTADAGSHTPLPLACTEFSGDHLSRNVVGLDFEAAEVVKRAPGQANCVFATARSCMLLANFFTELRGNRARLPILWGDGGAQFRSSSATSLRQFARHPHPARPGGRGNRQSDDAGIRSIPVFLSPRGDGPAPARESTRSWSIPHHSQMASNPSRGWRVATRACGLVEPRRSPEGLRRDRLGCACLFGQSARADRGRALRCPQYLDGSRRAGADEISMATPPRSARNSSPPRRDRTRLPALAGHVPTGPLPYCRGDRAIARRAARNISRPELRAGHRHDGGLSHPGQNRKKEGTGPWLEHQEPARLETREEEQADFLKGVDL